MFNYYLLMFFIEFVLMKNYFKKCLIKVHMLLTHFSAIDF